MEICGICGEEYKFITHTHLQRMHNMSIKEYLSAFPHTKLAWNTGLTKQDDSRVGGGPKKGHCLGHPNHYSREYLGDRFDAIEEKRKLKIGKTVVEKGIASMGGKASAEARKLKGPYKWKPDAPGRKSVKYLGRKPWTTGLTKYTSEKLKQASDKRRKYPEGIDFRAFGWTKELRQEIRNRDAWHCKKCDASQKEFKSVLVVHHRDGNRTHNSKDNLVTMCRKCHQSVHMEQDINTGRFKVRKELLTV